MSPQAIAAVQHHLGNLRLDLQRFSYFLASGTYWGGKPLSDEDRAYCESIVRQRRESIAQWERMI